MESPMVTRYCAHCGGAFHPRPQAPKQAFCSAPACQRTRKRQWQKGKLRSDPDYLANQRAAQRAWSARNEGYWRNWRQARSAPAQVERARQVPGEAAQRAQDAVAPQGAKMDVSVLLPGLYHLQPRPEFSGPNGASWLVEITPVRVGAPRKMDV